MYRFVPTLTLAALTLSALPVGGQEIAVQRPARTKRATAAQRTEEVQRIVRVPRAVEAPTLETIASVPIPPTPPAFFDDEAASFDHGSHLSGDQATDSLYRLARQALSREDYRRAATLFQQVRARDPKAPIAADALYWHAWSMYRVGGTTGLESALASLRTLERDYAKVARMGDARELRARVCGELARTGNEQCAAEISTVAGQAASSGSGGSASTSSSSGGGSGRSHAGTTRNSGQEQGCPDEDDDERVAALNALLQMDGERALPLLEKTLARRDRCSVTLRRKAVFLVSQKSGSRAADILLNAVKTDPDQEVREQAVFWLGQIRDDRAIAILEELLKTEKNEDVLDKAIFAISQHKSAHAATILRDMALRDNAPKHMREQAIFWIGQQRSSDNVALLTGLYRRVNDEELKDKIIFSVSQMRSSETDKFLLDLAMNESEGIEMRKKALFWAGQNRSLDSQGLTSIYDKVTNREMREQVIFVFSQRRDAGSVDKLIEIAKNDKDRELRKKAMFWLSQSRDPRVLKFLEEILNK